MFSIRLAAPATPATHRVSLGQRLAGKAIGFVAGLVLMAGLDALFLHHVLWQSASETFALHHPTATQAARAAWASFF